MKVRKISLKYFNPVEAARQGLDEPGWWMYDPNSPDVKWVGPYGTKAEANDDRIGLERFWKNDSEARSTDNTNHPIREEQLK